MKRRVTERVLVLILSVAVLLSSTGVYTVFATQQNTASAETVADSTTAAQESTTTADTQENIVLDGGAIEPDVLEGDGTANNPYLIADVDDLFLMQSVINDSTKTDKNFRLVSDIDLSGVTVADLKENSVTPGSIISVDKTLNDANPKSVWFNLNAANHKIFGLNVTNTDLDGVAIFGYIGRKSTVKNLVVENCSVTVNNSKATSASVVVLENNGTFRNSTINNVTLNIKDASDKAAAGAVAATNGLTISDVILKDVKVSAAASVKSIGALAGINNATITNIKATGIGVTTSKENKTVFAGAVAGVSNSMIKNCTVALSALAYGTQSGGIAGFNKGRIEGCAVSSASTDAVIRSEGISGGIAGKNEGRIIASTASGIVADCNGVYGGIAGEITASSVIENCVSTGSVKGSAVSGGIAGKAENNATVKNSYTFTALSGNAALGAVVGQGLVKAEGNCWSSDISGRYIADESGSEQGNLVTGLKLVTIKAGESKKISLASFNASFGSADITVDTEKPVSVSGTGVKLESDENSVTVSALSANKAATITYAVKITVKAGYNNSTVLSRNLTSTVITLSQDATGNGLTAESSIVIEGANELSLIKAAPFAYYKLGCDMEVPESFGAINFNGSLDGAGYTLTASAPVFKNVFGQVKNLTVKLNGEINTAMFGSANGAAFENVRLVKGESENEEIRLVAAISGVSPFINTVKGNTVISSCYAEIPVHVTKKDVSNVAGLVAVVDSFNATIKSSGANVTITSEYEDKLANSAGSIGYVKNNINGSISGCFATLSSTVVDYALIGGGVKESFKAENNLVSSGTVAVAPKDFENVTASMWKFDAGEQGFIAGKGSVVSITLPEGIDLFNGCKASDFTAVYDSKKLTVNVAGITIKDGVLYLPVQAAEGVVTVLNTNVTLIHKPTGVKATIGVSNGLEKDENGNYIIYYAVDIAFVGENLDRFNGASFVVANDIDMSKLEEFTSMGSAAQAFTGTFDGCGHTITGMNIDGASKVGLFGAVENATVKNIVIDSANVKASGSYAGVLAGLIGKNSVISNITIKNSTVSAQENYAGLLSGYVSGENIKLSGITVNGGSVSALNYAGGIFGYGDGEIALTSSKTSDIAVNASGFAGGVAGYASALNANNMSVASVKVDAKKNAGAFAGVFAGEIKASTVDKALVSGDIAGGFIGSTIKDTTASVVNCKLVSSKVSACDEAMVAGGFIASVVDGSAAEISNCSASADSSVVGAYATGGFIGDVQGEVKIADSASYQSVSGFSASTKLPSGVGGVIGKVGCTDFGLVSINNVNVGGAVSGYDFVGGVIGTVLSEKADGISVSDCVVAAKINTVENENSAFVIGNINEDLIQASVENVVFSSYGSELDAFAVKNGDGTYTDLDKFVESSLNEVVKDSKEITVSVNVAKAGEFGFAFDNGIGWQSESDERLTVISSDENSVTFVANKTSDCAVVASYILESDKNIVLRVHFNVTADIRLSLNGQGTKESPYIISDAFELDAVRDYMGEGVYFVLANDISFTENDFAFGGNFYNKGAGFLPFGTSDAPFKGVFDGAGYSINGLKVTSENASLFGSVENAQIKNISINAQVEGVTLAAVVATKATNSTFENITVSGSVSATSENASVAGVTAFANASEFKNITVKSMAVSTLQSSGNMSVAYASGVVARAIEASLDNINILSDVTVKSADYASAVVGYAEKVTVNNAEAYATVNGEFAGGVFAKAIGSSVEDAVVSGKIEGGVSAGIAGVATDSISASDVVVSASIVGEKSAIAVSKVSNTITTDFSNIIYSSYQNNDNVFGDADFNSAQLESCAGSFIDVNSMSVVDGDKLTLGKDSVKLENALKLDFDANGNAASFTIGAMTFSVEGVASQPENLVAFDGSAVTAVATKIDGAELIIEYSYGIRTSVDMIAVAGMTGDGTQENPYEISNEDTMLLLAIYPDAHFVLANNIELTKEWTPVSAFTGTLDGNGFTVNGLKVNADNAGLFETLDADARISDIKFTSAQITGKANAGVVAANVCGNAQLMNITVADSTIKADGYAAAIAGNINASECIVSGCEVTGCSVEGKNAAAVSAIASGNAYIKSADISATTIVAEENASGVVAVADADELTIESCDVSADVSGNNAAGIVAVSENELQLLNCNAEGTVKGINAESGLIAVVNGELSGEMKVSGNTVSATLSGEADSSASVVGVFTVLPEDDTTFTQMFNNNKVNNGVDSFQPEIMQYQNVDIDETKPESQVTFKGEGTQESPYQIYTVAELNSIPASSDAYYVLMNDIVITKADYELTADAEGNSVYGALYNGYNPIKDFAGSFDGNGHIISGLYIESDDNFVGLFANLKATATVKNVHLKVLDDAQGFGFSGIRGAAFVGGIAGYCEAVNGIVNCSVDGGAISGERAVGSIVGELASSKLVDCVAMTVVNGENGVGGVAGVTKGNCAIENTVAASAVNAAGGTVVGNNEGNLEITDLLSTGSAKGTESIAIGENNGSVSVLRAIIGGTNPGAASSAVSTDDAEYVYSDVTALGTNDKNVTSVSAGNLMAQIPQGLDGWVSAQGRYPAPAFADKYSQSLVALASVAVVADVKEGPEVVNGFAYPVSIEAQDIAAESSVLSGENDLVFENGKIYNDIFSGEMPYVVISATGMSRRIVLPQRNDENTLYVSSAQHLEALSNPENKYSALSRYLNNENAAIVLTADIDFKADPLNGDNAIDPINNYLGSFDGNGFVISNMRIDSVEGPAGLFATIGSDKVTEFKNVTFRNVFVTGAGETGALAGIANENVAVESISVTDATQTGASYVSGSAAGAVIGEMNGGTVNNVFADVTVDGKIAVGGIIGNSDAVITNSHSAGTVNASVADSALTGVGGLVGVMNSGSVITSSSVADVNVNGVSDSTDENSVTGIGGLVGVAVEGEIKESFSAGSVKVTDAKSADDNSIVGIGGLVGVAGASIESAYSSSAVTADFTASAEDDALRAIGGLVGVAENDIEDAYASGGVSVTRDGVKLFGSDCFAGGVIGYGADGKYKNLYFDKYMNNDENLTAVSNVINETCFRVSTDELIAAKGLSSAFVKGEGTYPYLKSVAANANGIINTALSIIVTAPDSSDESAFNGSGATKAVTLPGEITVGNKAYALSWVAEESAVLEGAKASLNRTKSYADYMSLTVSVEGVNRSYDRLYADAGSVEEAIGNTSVEYSVVNESGNRRMNSSVMGILIKSRLADGSVVTSDIFTTCDAQPIRLNKLLVTEGGFYVGSSVASGYDLVVNAKDSAGNEIKVTDAGSQGVFIETAGADSVTLEITIVKKDIPWGLTSLWESLTR